MKRKKGQKKEMRARKRKQSHGLNHLIQQDYVLLFVCIYIYIYM